MGLAPDSTSAPRAHPVPRWHLRRYGWALDVVIALVVGAVSVLGSLGASHWEQAGRELNPFAFVLLGVNPVLLLFRRRWPAAVLLTLMVTTGLYFGLGYPHGPSFLPMFVAFFSAVVLGRRLVAWVAAGVLTLHMSVTYLIGLSWAPELAQLVGAASWLLVVLVSGEVVRARRQYVRATEERVAEAERTRDEEARRRASEERLRIAREVHDVLAHNISLINVQAGVALHLMDERPEQARSALAAIKQASKETLAELRATLGVLRQVDDAAPLTPASSPTHPHLSLPPEAPAPSPPDLTLLGDLAARASAAGLKVRTEVDGEPRPLPPRVDQAAFRIVQEALTNVARHARPASATVRVTYSDEDLTVQVDDDGRGVAGTELSADGRHGGGHGIRGMRERAAALGGQLEAGPRPGGGFRVRATLPLEGGR
jgi:signal transduction histidine kinase